MSITTTTYHAFPSCYMHFSLFILTIWIPVEKSFTKSISLWMNYNDVFTRKKTSSQASHISLALPHL